MKIFSATVFSVALLSIVKPGFAAPLSITGNISYEYTKQAGQTTESTPNITMNLDSDLNNNLSVHSSFETSRTNTQPVSNTVNYAYLQLSCGKTSYEVGKPSYTLSNGLIASISGMNSILVTHKIDNAAANLFYSKDGQGIEAADFAASNIKWCKNITLETVYFKMNGTAYAGITASGNLTKNNLLSIETSENLATQTTGYLITNKFGNALRQGQSDLSISYRDIKSGAVSEYSIDSNYDNSKGVRVETDYKIDKHLTLTAFQDFVKTQDHSSNKNETDVSLSQDF
jgi:hypothetical protein